MGINRSKKIIALVILSVLTILLSVMVFKQYDNTLFSHNAVSAIYWLPLLVFLIVIGAILKDLSFNGKLKTFIMIYPVLHILGILSIFVFPLIALVLITAPVNFFGEAIAIGYIIQEFIFLKKEDQELELELIFVFIINIIIVFIAINDLINDYLGGIF